MSFDYNLDLLKRDFEQRKHFTLFVGAGLNADKEIKLLWNDLIKEACEFCFRTIGNEINLDYTDINRLLSILDIIDINPEDWIETATDSHPSELYIQNLLSAKNYANTHFPVEIQVSIMKTLLGNSYLPFLQDYLYNQCNKDIIKRFFSIYRLSNDFRDSSKKLYTLYFIARMIILNPQIQSVITYNFDNFLTFAINYLLNNASDFFSDKELTCILTRYNVKNLSELNDVVAAVDVCEYNQSQIKRDYKTIPIYHVHGYIPSPDELQNIDESSIILSMDEFCSTLTDLNSWKLSVQESAILTSNCIFIGDSLTDLSTKRILNIHKKNNTGNHIYMLSAHNQIDESNNSSKVRDALRKIRNTYLTTLGVKVIDSNKGFENLFSEIAKISAAQ